MICPRCDSDQAGLLVTSPEPPAITDSPRYHSKFKVNPVGSAS